MPGTKALAIAITDRSLYTLKLKVLPGNSHVFFILGFGFDYGLHQLLSVFNLLSFSAKLAPP